MEHSQNLPDDFLQLCQGVTAKRPIAIPNLVRYESNYQLDLV